MQLLKLTNHVNSGKLAGFQSLNTSVEKNEYCQKMRSNDSICKACYAATMEKRYKGLRDNIQSNGELLSASVIDRDQLPFINASVFRLHSTGELINDKHLINFINLASKNNHCRFVLWTKRTDIVNKVLRMVSLPDNLKLIYSNPKVDSKDIKPPKHFTKVFSVYSKGNPTSAEINCHSKCKDCMICYTDNDIANIRELIK